MDFTDILNFHLAPEPTTPTLALLSLAHLLRRKKRSAQLYSLDRNNCS